MDMDDAPIAHFVSPGAVSSESIFDEYALNPRFQQLQTELRSWLFVGAYSRDQTRENSPTLPLPLTDDSHDQDEDDQQQQQQHQDHKPGHQSLLEYARSNGADQIPLARKVKYLQVWITDCAPWLDMFDQERHFGVQVPILSQSSAAVFHAMLAVAARMTERRGARPNKTAVGVAGSTTAARSDSLELYSQAISSLTSSLNSTSATRDTAANTLIMVTAACLLCVLEMMSVSPRDWRRHVEGCAALFASAGINGFSGGSGSGGSGLLQAVFWCYARMDLCGAIIADGAEATVLPIGKWVLVDDDDDDDDDEAITQHFLAQGHRVPDMYANFSVYLCAKVTDLLSRRTRHTELDFGGAGGAGAGHPAPGHGRDDAADDGLDEAAFAGEWNALWAELQTWSRRRPVEMLPIKSTTTQTGSTADHLFPRILFAHWAAISSNQLYHTACILMLEMREGDGDGDGGGGGGGGDPVYSALWHARRVVGISLTNPHAGCINNAIQPLYVAGRLFTHRQEQRVIVDLIDSIEARTGWGSRWRIKDLEEAWGYRRGTFAAS